MSNDHPGGGVDSGAVDSLVPWLAALGLERYAPAMQAQGIDLRSLPLLSDSDLAELGVLLGHRKLLRKALAELDDASKSVRTGTPPPEPQQAERRQITVMFCDLVGSTEMAESTRPRSAARVDARLPAGLRQRDREVRGSHRAIPRRRADVLLRMAARA